MYCFWDFSEVDFLQFFSGLKSDLQVHLRLFLSMHFSVRSAKKGKPELLQTGDCMIKTPLIVAVGRA